MHYKLNTFIQDEEWAQLMAEIGEQSSEEMEVVVIKEYDGGHHEEDEEYLSGFGDRTGSNITSN